MAKFSTKMIDSDGNEIPIKYVSKYDRLRDRQVRKIAARFVTARAMLAALVRDSIKDLAVLMNAKDKLGAKGNFSAQSFDALISVSIRQQYNIRLDERVAKAREMMCAVVNDALSRVKDVDMTAIKLLVEEAFKVNSCGFLSTGKVIKLLRMEVRDPKWREAKEILQSALKTEKGKRYLICETRPSTQKDFRPIRLDLADCWPVPADQAVIGYEA